MEVAASKSKEAGKGTDSKFGEKESFAQGEHVWVKERMHTGVGVIVGKSTYDKGFRYSIQFTKHYTLNMISAGHLRLASGEETAKHQRGNHPAAGYASLTDSKDIQDLMGHWCAVQIGKAKHITFQRHCASAGAECLGISARFSEAITAIWNEARAARKL